MTDHEPFTAFLTQTGPYAGEAESLNRAAVRELLTAREAVPLLPDDAWTPIRYAGRWYAGTQLDTRDAACGELWRPVDDERHAQLDLLHARLEAASRRGAVRMTSADFVGTSVELVEKALVGSLLNNPALRGQVPWLGVEDFTNPLCRALWTHLDTHHATRPQPLAELVDLSDTLGRETELHPRLRTPAELATLILHAHDRPAVAEYGRILVEATTRRQVAAMGLRLDSLATRHPERSSTRSPARSRTSRRSAGAGTPPSASASGHSAVRPAPPHPSTSTRLQPHRTCEPRRARAWTSRWPSTPSSAPPSTTGHPAPEPPPCTRSTRRTSPTAARRPPGTPSKPSPGAAPRSTWSPAPGKPCGTQPQRRRAHHPRAPSGPRRRSVPRGRSRNARRSILARVISRAQRATTRQAGDLGVGLACVLGSTATQHAAVAAAAQRLTSDRTRLGTRHGAGPAKTRELTV